MDFPFLFFLFFVLTNSFVLHVSGSCDIHGIRTTAVRDVTMMYCIRNSTCATIAIGIVMVITHHLLGLHVYTKSHYALMGLLMCLLDLPQNQHCVVWPLSPHQNHLAVHLTYKVTGL